MSTNHNAITSSETLNPAAPWPPQRRRAAVRLLYAALALQLAAWIALVATTGNPTSAVTKAHLGFPAVLVAGGAIWLVQFAAAVVAFHRRTTQHQR